MLTHFKNDTFILKLFVIVASGAIVTSPVKALNVTSGQLIQTIHPQALAESSALVVNDFFDDNATKGVLRTNILNDVVMGPAPLPTNTFVYEVHSPRFVEGHPNRSPGINSFPSNFDFDTNDIVGSAVKGRIGLGGVMRYELPPLADGTPRFFISGDWTIEYGKTRVDKYDFSKDPNKPINPVDFGVSGWIMRNHFDFPIISYDVLNPTILTGVDSFYLSGKLGWSPEMTEGFFPEGSLYTVVADFVMCAQDDDALASNPAKQIPCVFPNITVNGQKGIVNIDSPRQINLEVDLGLATTKAYQNADYFAAFVYDGTLYWLNQNFEWTTVAVPAYQGALFDFRSISIPTPSLPSGSFLPNTTLTIYFGVDSTKNSVFDEPYRFSSVKLHIN